MTDPILIHKNPLRQIIDPIFIRHAEKQGEKYVEKYARNSDGSQNEDLAKRIRWEVNRRKIYGLQLDVEEPALFAAEQIGWSVLASAAIKVFTHRKEGWKAFGNVAIGTLLTTTILNNAVHFMRIGQRYDAGLRGAAETAIDMYNRGAPLLATHGQPGNWQEREDQRNLATGIGNQPSSEPGGTPSPTGRGRG
jgi:hypothetical protein